MLKKQLNQDQPQGGDVEKEAPVQENAGAVESNVNDGAQEIGDKPEEEMKAGELNATEPIADKAKESEVKDTVIPDQPLDANEEGEGEERPVKGPGEAITEEMEFADRFDSIGLSAEFKVAGVDGNGALKKEDEGFTLRLEPLDSKFTKKTFRFNPSELHLGVVTPEVAAKFKVGDVIGLVLVTK